MYWLKCDRSEHMCILSEFFLGVTVIMIVVHHLVASVIEAMIL